jgi:hypothetical protein
MGRDPAQPAIIEPFFFDPTVLEALAAKFGATYREAVPFPHAVIDDLVPDHVLGKVVTEFPRPGQAAWFSYDSSRERKLEFTDETGMGAFTRHLLSQFNSSVFVAFLEQLTGIAGLIPDPHYAGGGLHQIERGGYLKVHADFNRHPRLVLERRLNLLVYLNPGWRDDWGGHLELWDREMTHCEERVLPVSGRCVIFNTTSTSFHGHPEALQCPEGVTRKSLALYYYTARGPAEPAVDDHGTLFRSRPDEEWDPELEVAEPLSRRLLPPALADGARMLRDRGRRRAFGRRLLPPAVADRVRAARRRARPWST